VIHLDPPDWVMELGQGGIGRVALAGP